MTLHNVKLVFSDNEEVELELSSEENLLDKAEQQGIYLANDCREGVCGVCSGKCKTGNYTLTDDTALSEHEKDKGMVLPCTMQVQSDTELHFDYPKSQCKPSSNTIISATISNIETIAENTASITVTASEQTQQLNYYPGQFTSINIPETDDWRAYSFANTSNKVNEWQFIIRLLEDGKMSNYLRDQAKVGDNIDIKSPNGHFYLRDITRPTLFFAGGTGISAIIVMLKSIAENLSSYSSIPPLVLYYGVNNATEFCCADELKQLEKTLPQLIVKRIAMTVEKNNVEDFAIETGLITQLLSEQSVFNGNADCYMCGPPPMLAAIEQWFEQAPMSGYKFYSEKFVASKGQGSTIQSTEMSVSCVADLSKPYKRAVVVGGSISGIINARVLSDYFQEVIIVERDDPHHIDQVKKSTPQAHHAHHLLQKGQRELAKLFPELLENLVAAGTQAYDSSKDYRIFQNGNWKHVFNSDITIMAGPRRIFETVLRRQLYHYANIGYRYNANVDKLLLNDDSSVIEGVGLSNGEKINADFIVDASGKNSSFPKMLNQHGYPLPKETSQELNIYYSTYIFELTAQQVPEWGMMLLYGTRPIDKDFGYAALYGKNKQSLLVTLCSYGCEKPIRNHDEFISHAKSIVRKEIFEMIKNLTPVTELRTFKYPKMFRRHFEQQSKLPQGFIASGDALGSADPISGAGMTKAVLEAQALNNILAKNPKHLTKVPNQFYQQAAKLFDYIWFVISEQNFRFPWVKGKRPFYQKIMKWYVDQVLDLAHYDEQAFRSYLMVMHLNDHVLSLMKPKMLLKVCNKVLFKRNKTEQINTIVSNKIN
ncbi:FAD-binding oxidoreductase [Thalassotalea psychrophila]|uniref:FAD-binding oxidoreductase n=1 Tax=Thalassotalea psychrophila TaxID=3065647 RepID=A0ABY9TYY7_9GAMM|nr:FAD-binding oxidoreductase [Colwelliaceae bacterium SQ149]